MGVVLTLNCNLTPNLVFFALVEAIKIMIKSRIGKLEVVNDRDSESGKRKTPQAA